MKSIPAAVEICPYCKKPFKRLKSHLPHCKMAGDTLFTLNSTDISSPVPVTSNSATPKCLNTKKKEKIKNTEKASKKEDKKSKPKLIGNEGKVKANSVQPVDMAPVSNLVVARPGEDIEQGIKHSTKKSQQSENGMSRAPGKELVHIQTAEKELSKTNLLKKSPRVQKSRNKITFDEEKITSGIIHEPLIQGGQATSRSPDQLAKKTSARQTKEGFAKLNVCSWVDSSMDSLQSIPQGVDDEVEQVIENHHVRVLRKRHDSSVQNIPLNEASIGNQKIRHQPVESSASADTSLATEKQIVTGTENRVVDLELEGNAWTVANVPDQLAAGVKSMTDKNQLSFVSHEESLVYHNPKSNPYSTFTEILQRRDSDEKYNCNLSCLEKDTALDSGIIVITRGTSSGISLQSSVHMLEMAATQRLSSPKTGVQPGSLGLEWFPELYPNYQNLLTGKQKQWDTGIPKTQFIVPHEDWKVLQAGRSLMDAKLQDLPAWIGTCNLSPQGMLRATCKAWNGYYSRYINVKKGGVAGISMLLLGYCTLSYIWNYKHIKQDRWRKYH